MISRIRKYQDSWLVKGILLLTALSFMSLFGISGYINDATANKTAIKVGKIEILQGELMNQYNKQAENAKRMLGDKFNDNMRAAIIQQLISQNLSDMVMSQTTEDLNMSISDNLLRDVVFSRAEFMDDYGKFNLNKMRRTLLMYGTSEAEYLKQLNSEIKKQHLIYSPLENINASTIAAEYAAKAKNLKKTFKYIKIDTDKTKTDRKISQEETEQYYQDFITEFTNPEQRDVEFVMINDNDAAQKIVPTQDEIDAYYKEHVNKFETPEQRNVLQMVLNSEEDALNAVKDLQSGKDFYAVAKDSAKQSVEDTNFGLVAKDMLAEEIADIAFSTTVNKISAPVQSEFGWHIIKVAEVKPMTKMNKAKAKELIIDEIRKEKAYESLRDLTKEIDDKIGGGANLQDVAKEFNLNIYNASGITEDGNVKNIPAGLKNIVTNTDFVDTAFSYNIGEVSQTLETDSGIVILSVKNVVEAQPKEINEVKDQIEKLWATNEKTAIVQEIVENVMNDLNEGDSMEDVSARLGLNMKRTKPLSRDDNFEDMTSAAMVQLFQEAYDTPKLIDLGNTKYIVVSEKVKLANNNVTDQEIAKSKDLLKLMSLREHSGYLIDSFARDYKIMVDYNIIGLGEKE